MRFQRERQGFASLKATLKEVPELCVQFLRAVQDVCTEYDTSIRENRFITGGIIEFIVGALLRAAGIPVVHRGARQTRLDLPFQNGDGGYSVKALIRASSTHLVNTLGESGTTVDMWQEPTIFVVRGFGLVYADPDLPWWQSSGRKQLRPRSDALQVMQKTVMDSVTLPAGNPEHFVALPTLAAVTNPPDTTKIASAVIAT